MLRKIISAKKKSSDGEKAERLAEQFLIEQGYQAIARNFHSRVGEIDIIMQNRSTYVFVEVRYRANATRGSASESITPHKYRRIL